MSVWSQYFHFPTNTNFEIDGPYGYNGQGLVLENSDRILKLRMDLDKWGPAPALHATLTIEYRQEGEGNIVVIAHDDRDEKRDENASIWSFDDQRKRNIASDNMALAAV